MEIRPASLERRVKRLFREGLAALRDTACNASLDCEVHVEITVTPIVEAEPDRRGVRWRPSVAEETA